jgi:hypothetical protein
MKELKTLSKKDIKKYNNLNGMNTKFWGPNLWNFLFTSILGSYPVCVKTKYHKEIRNQYLRMIYALQYTLPCKFCRKSFSKFIKYLNPKKFSKYRITMFYWLYLIKDLVNKKLLKQEKKVKKLKFKTKPTPPLKNVLEKYNKYRASCDDKLKSCSKSIFVK